MHSLKIDQNHMQLNTTKIKELILGLLARFNLTIHAIPAGTTDRQEFPFLNCLEFK